MSDEFKYEVVVSNVGTVYRSNNRGLAQANFENYRQLSGLKTSRAAGEIVTLFCDGMIIAQTKGVNRAIDTREIDEIVRVATKGRYTRFIG